MITEQPKLGEKWEISRITMLPEHVNDTQIATVISPNPRLPDAVRVRLESGAEICLGLPWFIREVK